MLELYWGLLITGVLFALVTVLFGDLLGHALGGMFDWMSGDLLHVLQPMVLFSGITVLGGAGILLTKYTGLAAAAVFALGLIAAAGSCVLIYLFYIKPMRNLESSLGFSMQDLVGRIGEVTVPIPSAGSGEVVVRIGGGVTNQIAESFDGSEIPWGRRVVTVEVISGVLMVTELDSKDTGLDH
ncbi:MULTISPECIES: protease [Paenibacillus]|uniref:protease n=1 Tax=Paenibacillus TaxID=44249 RepID=UPI0022B93F37|nr:protease [Paenibacillus caseinilyticus]MCZ8522725.1 protease [Paenibacillus caseinilyticus]